jgi:Cof subfamily protein (haloacid dehalogenase superfamily)
LRPKTLLGLPTLADLSLVALDLDGTVMCPYGKTPISTRCLSAVARLQQAGLPVTFVTGRTEDYALPIAQRFGVTTPIVTYNGGRLYCPAEQRVLHQAAIPEARTAELLDWLDGLIDVVAVYWGTDRGLRLVQNRCSGDPASDDYLFGVPREIVGSLADAQRPQQTLSKVIVVTREPMEGQLSQRFGQDVEAVRTHPDLFEILPSGVCKGAGVSRLCQHLDISPSRVLAVGDQHNDVATFRVAGYSVAMGDAPESVKAAARWTTGDFSDEGCAQVLEALLAGQD